MRISTGQGKAPAIAGTSSGFSVPSAGRREIAGDAAHAHAILPVGRDRDVDHRIVEPGIVGIGGADRRIGGQLDDAVMLVGPAASSRIEHIMPRLSTPRIAATFSVMSLPGT